MGLLIQAVGSGWGGQSWNFMDAKILPPVQHQFLIPGHPGVQLGGVLCHPQSLFLESVGYFVEG